MLVENLTSVNVTGALSMTISKTKASRIRQLHNSCFLNLLKESTIYMYLYHCLKMTFKSLLNFGSFGKGPTPALDRYHSAPSDYGHYDHGWSHGGHKGKGNSGGAALSALTLLAFLFLINVMQQSLENNNGTTTTFLREGEQPVASARGDQAPTKIVTDSMLDKKYVPIKTSLQVTKDKN